jgi:serine/threonine protein kinase/Tol biopolymer transport system component
MTSDRWEQINRLYHAALEIEEKERPSFLEEACGADAALRGEVQSLLNMHAQVDGFLDKPAVEEVVKGLKDEPPSLLGRQLGPYQILGVLGAGGMGEVYRAKDSRLNRTVAIKVLPRHLWERADLRQRFAREARAIAGLNHANICALHDIGREDGIDFLVMEYLEGETLSKRLKRGPLPVEEVLRYAIQVTKALAQAHRRGVVHRDLKPGNIMLTKAGAKLLDFGLAKRKVEAASSRLGPSAGTAPLLSTESESLTEEGMMLGTLEYMAPEQVEGKEADHRTDIFALGVVIYEMATGRKAFEGDSKASLTAAILTSQPPPITAIQPMTPPALERLVRKCLNKDPEERWQSAADLATELEWVSETVAQPAVPTEVEVRRRRRERFAWVFIAVLLSILGSFLARGSFWKPESPTDVMHFTIPRPGNVASWWPVISPDGQKLAIGTDARSIWILPLNSGRAYSRVEVNVTGVHYFIFWSPDSRFVAYWEFKENRATLKKIEVPGGVPQPICETAFTTAIGFEPGSSVGFGTWNQNGVVLFKRGEEPRGISQVSAEGGTPLQVTTIDTTRGELDHVVPQFLPDGDHFLYYVESLRADVSGTYVGSLSTKTSRRLLQDHAVFAPPGYLLYGKDGQGQLLAHSFDARRLSLTGNAVPLRSMPETAKVTSVSENGILCYVSDAWPNMQVTVFDRAGKKLETIGPAVGFRDIDVSGDGTKLALEEQFAAESDIQILDLRRRVKTRLNKGGLGESNYCPRWSPDGSEILFSSNRDRSSTQSDSSHGNLYRNASSGQGQAVPLLKSKQIKNLMDISHDGRYILYEIAVLSPGPELWVLPLFGDRKPWLFQGSARDGRFSPDGRWVAYVSPPDWTPEANIFVRSFPSGERQRQVSTGGADTPRWRSDGKELFYFTDWKLMSATIKPGSAFQFDRPTIVFNLPEIPPIRHSYAVSPDGQLFYVLAPDESLQPGQIHVAVNWTADLPRR